MDTLDSPAGPGLPHLHPASVDRTTANRLAIVVGIVVIGRNEGDRLSRCLSSVVELRHNVVYVDSGSSDGSVALARTMAAAVVELTGDSPFTAARARNVGFNKLLAMRPNISYVFFVDGDCEVENHWLATASHFLSQHERVAVAWGFRRERNPGKSVYNMLCDYEWWDIPTGQTKICGGDALIRISAFEEVQGYRPELICGEEPEMCVRLRNLGWQIWRLNAPMTVHDADMFRFGQWWKRMLRGGYGFAQGAALHGKTPHRHGITESSRAWFWGVSVPMAAFLLTLIFGWRGLIVLALYPLQIFRLALRGKRTTRENWLRAVALVVSKFAEVLGQMKYLTDRVRGVKSQLIEYK